MVHTRLLKLENTKKLKGMCLPEEDQIYLAKLSTYSIEYSDPGIPDEPAEFASAKAANKRFNEAYRDFEMALKEREELRI